MVLIVEPTAKLSVHDLIGAGRLGVTVKKNAVIVSDKGDGTLAYHTIEWQGVT